MNQAGDRWVPVVSSVLVHALILAAVGWSWWHFSRTSPAPAASNLAIEATVVTAAPTAPQTAQPEAPAKPDAAQQAQAAEEQAKKQRELEAQREAEREATQKREAAEKQAVADARAEQERKDSERQAQEAREQKDREAKVAAEARAKAAAEAKAKAAADAKAAAEQQARQRQESELRAQLAAEERANSARAGAQGAQYAAAIRARVERAWIRPPSARPGLSCEVHVTQVPGGVVTAVSLGACNGDEAVKQSIVDAVYRASPLPSPENADLFERNLVFNFKPNE
jgi:colicin import membrane protein